MVDFDRARKMVERGTIEVAPLAFMDVGQAVATVWVLLHTLAQTPGAVAEAP